MTNLPTLGKPGASDRDIVLVGVFPSGISVNRLISVCVPNAPGVRSVFSPLEMLNTVAPIVGKYLVGCRDKRTGIIKVKEELRDSQVDPVNRFVMEWENNKGGLNLAHIVFDLKDQPGGFNVRGWKYPFHQVTMRQVDMRLPRVVQLEKVT